MDNQSVLYGVTILASENEEDVGVFIYVITFELNTNFTKHKIRKLFTTRHLDYYFSLLEL